MIKIAVIGSGISGLATAHVLAEKGFNVTILAKAFPPHTTSDKAAAFWFPYHIRNDKRGVQWCNISYRKYIRLSGEDTSSGVRICKLVKMIREENKYAELSWMDHMPPGSYRIMDQTELKRGYRLGFEASVPLIETQLFLPWLINSLRKRNIPFLQRELTSIDEISGEYDWVVNCTGLGSRDLCNDQSIYPVRGQVALIAPQQDLSIFLDNEQPMYIVPRKDATIIGGTYEEHVYEARPENETVQRLYKQAVNLFPNLQHYPLTGAWAGLRPFRNEVRIEKEKNTNIVHNYGHAGSGFTLAWGCAEHVYALITAN